MRGVTGFCSVAPENRWTPEKEGAHGIHRILLEDMHIGIRGIRLFARIYSVQVHSKDADGGGGFFQITLFYILVVQNPSKVLISNPAILLYSVVLTQATRPDTESKDDYDCHYGLEPIGHQLGSTPLSLSHSPDGRTEVRSY